MRSDQLTKLMSRAIIFVNFNEAIFPPPFLPTYKCRERSAFDIHSDSAYSGLSSASSNNLKQTDKTPSTSSSETADESPKNIKKLRVKPLDYPRKFTPSAGIYKEGYELDRFAYNVSRVPSFTDRILYQKGHHDDKDV